MLFDLQGKRRRVVQVTYVTLAVLMGGGLVLFGVGGEAPGGLFDAFSDRNGGGAGSDIVEERIDRNEERIAKRPKDVEARKELVRDYVSSANAKTPSGTQFSEDAREDLQRASTHWGAYLELEPDKPDTGLARLVLQVFDPNGLNQPQSAMRAARIVAEDANDPASYLLLVQYATIAGDKRTEKLASQKALALAKTPENRKIVRDELKRYKQAQAKATIPAGAAK